MKLLLIALAVIAQGVLANRELQNVAAVKYSKYDGGCKCYQPVTEDALYKYYRIPITLETRSFAMDQPGPDSKLLQMAWAGLVRDSRAGNVIGEYSSTSTTVEAPSAPGRPVDTLLHGTMELGPQRSNTLVFSGGYEAVLGEVSALADHDLAIVGGTGQFLSAGGYIFLTSSSTGHVDIIAPKVAAF